MNEHDQKLRALIARHEGRRARTYVDTMGHPTVGVGFNLDRADAAARCAAVGADYAAVRAGTTALTDAQIDGLLDRDIADGRETIKRLVPDFDALDVTRQHVLLDLLFNLGPSGLGKFHNLLAAVGSRDFERASHELETSRWAGQVGVRAREDVAMLRTGNHVIG